MGNEPILPFAVVCQARRIMSHGLSLKAAASYLYVTVERLDRSLWTYLGEPSQ